MKKFITKSYKQTQELGKKMAQEILNCRFAKMTRSCHFSEIVLCLYGDLGSGKTTFLQGFAKGLGVKEKILSPTFVILKRFKITKSQIPNSKIQTNPKFQIPKSNFTNFYHIDAYRLRNYKDAEVLGLKEIFKNPKNIVAIEWPEKIKKILPKNAVKIKFKFILKNERSIGVCI